MSVEGVVDDEDFHFAFGCWYGDLCVGLSADAQVYFFIEAVFFKAEEPFPEWMELKEERAATRAGSKLRPGAVEWSSMIRFDPAFSSRLLQLLRRDVRTLLGDGTLHHEHQCDERNRERGKDEEDVEIGERGGLLLAQVVE